MNRVNNESKIKCPNEVETWKLAHIEVIVASKAWILGKCEKVSPEDERASESHLLVVREANCFRDAFYLISKLVTHFAIDWACTRGHIDPFPTIVLLLIPVDRA